MKMNSLPDLNDGRYIYQKLTTNRLCSRNGLADPLRRLIDGEVEISRYKPELLRGGEDLPEVILRAWRNWREMVFIIKIGSPH
jgi:hypothetical protein